MRQKTLTSVLNSEQIATEQDQSSLMLSKKRPETVKLDIEKMFQESIALTDVHNKLLEENKKLQKDFKKVEEAKRERQQFISMVEKIVKQKSSQIAVKNGQNSSWLVFKLHKKICDLKNEIQLKDKQIKTLKLSKENQIIFRKQVEIQCLKQILEFAQQNDIQPNICEEEQGENQAIKQIIWMQDFYETEQLKLINLNAEFEQEERSTKRILLKLAEKKTELKRMKEMKKQYLVAQHNYNHEKKKKEQNASRKSYFTNLLKERDEELKKLEELKDKKVRIINQEEEEIKQLEQQLAQLKKEYQDCEIVDEQEKQETVKVLKNEKSQEWVKRVTINQISYIADNINSTLSLKGVSHQEWIDAFFRDRKQAYSIQDIVDKLGEYPFEWKDEEEKKIIARYVVEDIGSGYTLQDMSTTQQTPIIRSILNNIIGEIRTYTQDSIAELKQQVGEKLCKFWSLIVQVIQLKEGTTNFVGKQAIYDGFQNSQLNFSKQQIDFTILYLFSWSRDSRKLQVSKLGKMKQLGINIRTNNDE